MFSLMLTFKNVFTQTLFVDDMRDMVSTIAKAYDCPVDIEFAVNFVMIILTASTFFSADRFRLRWKQVG